ncbi:MAG: transglutaminase-like cysteine peptidase [Patescibacteria group bacterium]
MQNLFRALLAALLLSASLARADNAEPFGFRLVPLQNELWQKQIEPRWREVTLKLYRDIYLLHMCEDDSAHCTPESTELLALIQESRKLSGLERIEYVNTTVNRAIEYVADWAQWDEEDRWSTPLETLETHWGDCEDYLLLKYVALLLSGVPRNDIRGVIVDIPEIKRPRELHAVLAVRFEGRWLILDPRYEEIRADVDSTDYVPEMNLVAGIVRQYDRAVKEVAAAQ